MVWYILGAIALALAAGIVFMSEWEIRRARHRTKDVLEDAIAEAAQDLTVPDPPDFRSVAEIHSFYEELKDRDPIRAGKAMYAAQLKLHEG